MHSSNFSLAVNKVITALGEGSIGRCVVYHELELEQYYVFEKNTPAEMEFVDRFSGATKILDMGYFQIKVFIHQIKEVRRELGIDGANKETLSGGECSGSEPERLDVRTTGLEKGGPDNSAVLPGADDNLNESDPGSSSGNRERSSVEAGIKRKLTESEKAEIMQENINIPNPD